jgi:peptidoglycan/LPS O-acetylase OafA/YrhL
MAGAGETGSTQVVQAGEVRSARIESLRAVAALGVLAFHALFSAHDLGPSALLDDLAYGGGLGVSLFFTLTGYLLFWPFARHLFGNGRPVALDRYARNRALRILPLYYVVLATLLVLGHGGGSAKEWLRFGTFTQSFFHDTVVNDVDQPMWSLAVEIEFYVLLPLLAFVLGRLSGRSLRRAAALVGTLALASLVVWLAKVYGVNQGTRWTYSLPATFFQFTPGMLLALLRLGLERHPRPRLPSSTLLIVAGVACWVVATQARDQAGLIVAPASFLLLAGVVLPVSDGRLVRVLELRWLVVVGVASYSLYLWHAPILNSLSKHVSLGLIASLLVATAVCVPVALASYGVVERPFLRFRRRWGSTVARQPDARPQPEPVADAAH